MDIKRFLRNNNWKTWGSSESGWGNGYVCIPKEHPLFAKGYGDMIKLKTPVSEIPFNGNIIGALCYAARANSEAKSEPNEISIDLAIDVHGGITYAAVLGEHMLENGEWLDPAPERKDMENWWVFGFDTSHWHDNPTTCNREFVIQETDKLTAQLKNIIDKVELDAALDKNGNLKQAS